jgi:hypothetical protein
VLTKARYDTSRDGYIDFKEFQKLCSDIDIEESEEPEPVVKPHVEASEQRSGLSVNRKAVEDLVSRLRRAAYSSAR